MSCRLPHPTASPWIAAASAAACSKLNEDYYYCFGCQAKGDVISLTEKLFDLTLRETAYKLAADFGLTPSATLK